MIDHHSEIVWFAIRNELGLERKVMIWEVIIPIGHFYGKVIKSHTKVLPNLFDDFDMKMQIKYLIQIPLNCLVNMELVGRTGFFL